MKIAADFSHTLTATLEAGTAIAAKSARMEGSKTAAKIRAFVVDVVDTDLAVVFKAAAAGDNLMGGANTAHPDFVVLNSADARGKLPNAKVLRLPWFARTSDDLASLEAEIQRPGDNRIAKKKLRFSELYREVGRDAIERDLVSYIESKEGQVIGWVERSEPDGVRKGPRDPIIYSAAVAARVEVGEISAPRISRYGADFAHREDVEYRIE